MDKNDSSISLSRHLINVSERKNVALSGIKKIVSFDNEQFVMESTMGDIVLVGENLEIVKLNTDDGNVVIKGIVYGINYYDDKSTKNKESFFSKLFK